jgi:integrase
MSIPRSADRRFLERHGNKWRVVVPVPKKARAAIGKTKLRVPLDTDSLTIANQLKWPIIGELQRRIDLALRPDDIVGQALRLAQKRKDALAMLGDAEPEELEIDDLLDEVGGQPVGVDPEGFPILEPAREEVARQIADIAYGRRTPLNASRERYLSQLDVARRTKADDERAFGYLIDWCRREGVPAFRETFGHREAVRFYDFLGADPRHPRTLNKYLVRLSLYWKWMLKRGEVTSNVWEGLSIPVPHETDETEERPFTEAEMKKLLAGPAVQHMHDLMRIAALTGARLDVIVSLKVGDCLGGNFRFRAAKKEKRSRLVPIHPDLIEIINRRTHELSEHADLFPEWPPVARKNSLRERSFKVSQHFTTYRREVGVVDPAPNKRRDRVNFHSFRRWFITMAEQADQPESTIASVVGHARPGMTFGVYSAGPKLEQARRCVEAVKLPSVAEVLVKPYIPRQRPGSLARRMATRP